MSTETLRRENPQELIRILQQELTQTNREVLQLTVELDQRVEERTSELSAAQEELLRKNAELVLKTSQLEAANKELEAFSYSVSHDLRAPLRHIDGYLHLILGDKNCAVSETTEKYLRKASDAAAEMGKLIDDLLAFSRMGQTEMRSGRFNMDELVNDVICDMADDIQGRNIEWNIQPLPTVSGDRALLKQVWVNLLSNAVKYSGPRDPAKIKIASIHKSGEWQFSVEDNGVGFDPRYAGKMFGVFQRLHSAEEFEGTGIGLANVRRIILRHAGRTWAESEVGKGATFYFTLPELPMS
jgi:light-regulated signal transduction histidine kinase (bacteriophytochrome)